MNINKIRWIINLNQIIINKNISNIRYYFRYYYNYLYILTSNRQLVKRLDDQWEVCCFKILSKNINEDLINNVNE